MVKINGQEENAAGLCVMDYLRQAGFSPDVVVATLRSSRAKTWTRSSCRTVTV